MQRFLLLALVAVVGCDNASPADPPRPLSEICIQGTRFIDGGGATFPVFGFNYASESLTEDWDRETAWVTFADDIDEMVGYGANTVRVHLQFADLMDSPQLPNIGALGRLGRLIRLAEEKRVYLTITGLGSYRNTDPAWYTDLDERGRWAAHERFWRAIALVARESPAVLSYNLMNEPVAGVSTGQGWLPGDGFGGFYFVQNITLTPGTRSADEIFEAWTGQLTTAIRSLDPDTPITVGFLPLGPFEQFGENLDYLSTHMYPATGEIEARADYFRARTGGKPVVIEEVFSLASSAEDTNRFLDLVAPVSAGEISHYDGRTQAELDAGTDIGSALSGAWLRTFSARAPGS